MFAMAVPATTMENNVNSEISPPIEPSDIPCRLCRGDARYRYHLSILAKSSVAYFECTQCLSLQSEKPYWLDESYAPQSQFPDIRALVRILQTREDIYFLCSALGITASDRVLDWGGGNGLLVRMMRDLGINAYRYDLYIKNNYALGYEFDQSSHYSMVLAIQVWEHFDDAADEVRKIFDLRPDVVVISTGTYAGQGPDWEYLNAYGRHIFLFSLEARKRIGDQYGYQMMHGLYTVFHRKPLTRVQRLLLRIVLSGRFQRSRRLLFALLPHSSALRDADREFARHQFYDLNRVGSVNGP
jgi:hypothetical protein